MLKEEQKKSIIKELSFFNHEEEATLENLVEPYSENGYYSKSIAERYVIAKSVFKWLNDRKNLKQNKIQKVKTILYSNKELDFLSFNQEERQNLKVFAKVLENTIEDRPFWLRAFTDFHKPHSPIVTYS